MKKLFFTTVVMVSLLCALPFTLLAQGRTVTGKVLASDTGEPIPVASVFVKGQVVLGEYTDDNGMFVIKNVPADITHLIVSFMGYETAEVPIGSGKNLVITLQQDAVHLDDVVVTALGIQRQAKEIGYATAKVSSDDLTKTQNDNATMALVGKVSGLQINAASSALDASVRVQLRGSRSFKGGNQAMLVVDGIPTPLDYLSTMNPNDIENISVLKGGSAAALYGSSAANGVLYVTTKSGERGRPRITYGLTTTFDKMSYFPEYQKRFGPGSENSKGLPYYIPGENQQYGPEFDGSIVDIGSPFMLPDGTIKQLQETYSFKEGAREGYYQLGVGVQNNLSFSSAGDNGNFFMSYQHLHRTGTILGDEFNRQTIRLNASRKYKNFTAIANVSYSNSKGDSNNSSSNGMHALWNTPAHIDLPKYKDWKNTEGATPDQWINDYYLNPYAQIGLYRSIYRSDRFTGSATLEYKPLKWLRFQGRVGMTTGVSNSTSKTNAWHFNEYAKIDRTYAASGDIYSTVSTSSSFTQRLNVDAMVFAEHKFSKNFGIKGMVGWTMYDYYSESKGVSAGQLEIDNLFNVANKVGQLGGSNGISKMREQALYASIDFSMLGWLYLQITGRNDWTSLLNPGDWSFFYPGANMSIMLSDAIPGLKNTKWLSYLKLRGTFARIGSVSIGTYTLDNMAYVSSPFPFGSLTSYYVSSAIRDRYINPEFTTEFEVGLELGLFKDRITFEAAYYHQKTTDQTVNVSITPSTGAGSKYVNAGVMTGQGVELDLHLTPMLQAGDFHWNVNANATFARTEVTDLYGGMDELAISSPIYAIKGKQYPYIKATDFKRDPQGRVIVDAQTGLPSLGELIPIGATEPKVRLGLNTVMKWRGLSLSATFEYRGGHVIRFDGESEMLFAGTSKISAISGRQRFVFPNSVIAVKDGNGNVTYQENTNVTVNSGGKDFWTGVYRSGVASRIVSADAWKLRELSLTYDLPQRLLEKTKFFQRASLSFVGRNLFMWTPDTNIWGDPDMAYGSGYWNAPGISGNVMSGYRTFGFNLTLSF